MKTRNTYLLRYATEDRGIAKSVDSSPDLVVVIPSFKEPNIQTTLSSLLESYRANENLNDRVRVIIVVNHPESAHPDDIKVNEATMESIRTWKQEHQNALPVHELLVELPHKKAGVGLARKTGMDEAVRVFEQFDQDGIIVNLDADCTVSSNYLSAILNHFETYGHSPAASIYFEHQIEPTDTGILNYELFLRYFINAQRFCHLPFAYQTIGSSMAVRSRDYQKQGGMNSKKAGEDFYFIQKMLLLGKYSEINDCTVYPSSRQSDRVPFGTGRAMMEWDTNEDPEYLSYHPESFVLLQNFIEILPEMYVNGPDKVKFEIALPIWEFLQSKSYDQVYQDIRKKSTSLHVFQKHFFSWFDGFQLMKYLHFTRDNFYPNQPLEYCLKWLFHEFLHRDYPGDKFDALRILREFDKKGKAVVPWY